MDLLSLRSSPWNVEGWFSSHLFQGMLLFGNSRALGALLLPQSRSPHPLLLCSPRGPAWEWLRGGWAGRKVTSGAQGVGREAGIGVSGGMEQARTCHLSELIPRATSKSRLSCPARFSPFFPHSLAWDDTVLGCPCFRVWDSRLVEPICSGWFTGHVLALALLLQCLVLGPCCGCCSASLSYPEPLWDTRGVQITVVLLSASNSGCAGDP